MISRRFLRSAGYSRLLLFFLLSLIWGSCSNTKDSLVSRTFHNLSAHYNGYYNAGLKVDDGVEKVATATEDRYDRPLAVFKYGSTEKAKAIYPQMDDAMKRTGTVIQRHTILDKRGNEKPESEKWIDDNWLLYGKAQFYKHDYIQAIETFKFVELMYKKEPTRHLASLWLARTYLQLAQLNEVEGKLDYLRNQSDFPKKNKWELEAVNADYLIQIKNYPPAIDHLLKASILAPQREDRIRFMFILAQLYQQQGDYKKAFEMYTKVIKKNPKYEMAFNARINRARCYDANSENGAEVKKELVKMEKDPKNKDFLDQIYYALAGLSIKEGNEPAEIDYLNKSIRASTNNQTQKALSYLELGKIAYAKPNYREAQIYYDSTITNLPTDFPDYTETLSRRNSLTKLIKYLRTIDQEDSLQTLSRLSAADQEKLIEDKLKKEEEEKERKKQEEESQQVNQIFGNSRQSDINQFNQASGASWYFYNPQAISFGFNEFTKKWGSRKLEDNWRRSSKQNQMAGLEDEGDGTEGKDTVEIKDPKLAMEKKKKDMLKTIPNSPEAIQKSTTKVIEAYYNAAMIYREQLNDPKAAISTFEEMLQKYPKNKYELPAYYQLYRLYAQIGNKEKSDYYKNIILNEHGDSDYAEIIRNPNFAAERASRKSDLELFYEDTYRKYLNGEYASVMQRKLEADAQFQPNLLASKFDFLKTLSIGRTQSLSMFETSLQDIVRNYSGDPVKEEAENILDYIHGMNGNATDNTAGTKPPADDTLGNKKLFQYNPDTLHCVVIIFQSIGGAINGEKYKGKLSNFNSNNFGTKGYTISEMMFDHRLKMVIVKSFSDKNEALTYCNQLQDNDEVYGNISMDNYQQFVVSMNNFPELVKEKKTDLYEDFYRSFYR